MLNKYIVVIESSKPPQLFLGDDFAGGTIVELKAEELPHRVTAAWLAKRFNYSRKTIIEKVGVFNKGDENKHLYDPKEVLPVLENLNVIATKRGARRKN